MILDCFYQYIVAGIRQVSAKPLIKTKYTSHENAIETETATTSEVITVTEISAGVLSNIHLSECPK
jgi:hypothetical protein